MKYMHERGANREGNLEQARRECVDKEKWKLFCRDYSIGDFSGENKAPKTIDR